jgi:hypothetical protein
LILLDAITPQTLLFSAQRFQQALPPTIQWEVSASRSVPRGQVTLTLRLEPTRVPQDQGYELQVLSDGITLSAHDPAGIFYGVNTLIQLLRKDAAPPLVPCLKISDWPDFATRGVMLDVSRNKVPRMETLYALVDQLASWRINQLQLYTEHTFAYRQHPVVWANASPLTGQEIMELDLYCRERFVELVPNQNSFGHLRRWLKHPAYTPLAETTGRLNLPDGQELEGPFSLCPLDISSLVFLTGLYEELLPHFTSRLFNVGCDETFDLGYGRSKAACAARGKGRVYADFLLRLYEAVKSRGRTMQFWADIILQHPETLPLLPRDVIALIWGYEAQHPFDDECLALMAARLPFYVCPGTSSWNSLAGRTDNAIANLLNAAESGLRHGAAGYLITDWGDNGHWQHLPISYLGFAAGAAYAWALESNRDLDLVQALSQHAFGDTSGALGRVAHDLGNIYRAPGAKIANGSALFKVLQEPDPPSQMYFAQIPLEAWQYTLEAIEDALTPLASAQSTHPQAALFRREFEHAAALLRHASWRAAWFNAPNTMSAASLAQDLQHQMEEFQALWLTRNRPGGLDDSLALFDKILKTYGM